MALTTIRRNATRKLADIRATYTRVRMLDASSEWSDSTPDTAWTYYDGRPGSTLLHYNDTHDRYEMLIHTSLTFHLERPEGETGEQAPAADTTAPAPAAKKAPVKPKRGDLVIVETQPTYTVQNPGEAPRTERAKQYGLMSVTNLTREGRIRMVADVRYGDDAYPQKLEGMLYFTGRYWLVPAAEVDVDAAIKAARAHTYPNSDTPRAWPSLDAAKEALAPTRKDAAPAADTTTGETAASDDVPRTGIRAADALITRALAGGLTVEVKSTTDDLSESHSVTFGYVVPKSAQGNALGQCIAADRLSIHWYKGTRKGSRATVLSATWWQLTDHTEFKTVKRALWHFDSMLKEAAKYAREDAEQEAPAPDAPAAPDGTADARQNAAEAPATDEARTTQARPERTAREVLDRLSGTGRVQPPSKHTATDPASGSPYFPGAPVWNLRAAREAISGHVFPDVTPAGDLAPGKTGVWITNGRPERGMGRVMLVPVIGTDKGTHSERPRRGSAAEEQWLAARDDLRAQLADAGFSGFSDMKMGLEATPPAPVAPIVIELIHGNVFEEGLDALGRYEIKVPAHPHLHGLAVSAVSGHQSYVHVFGRADDKDPLFRSHSFRTLESAVNAWAEHCGFPEGMVTIIQK